MDCDLEVEFWFAGFGSSPVLTSLIFRDRSCCQQLHARYLGGVVFRFGFLTVLKLPCCRRGCRLRVRLRRPRSSSSIAPHHRQCGCAG